jgi:hypothetical protein
VAVLAEVSGSRIERARVFERHERISPAAGQVDWAASGCAKVRECGAARVVGLGSHREAPRAIVVV